MRHKITDNITVITFETMNPLPSEPTDRFSYYIVYRDSADKPRMTEEFSGFIGVEHCLSDANYYIDNLDMTPEPVIEREPKITTPYHTHICSHDIYRCVNPACEVAGEFSPQRVAEILCPKCGAQTGTTDYFKRQRLTVVEYQPLVVGLAVSA